MKRDEKYILNRIYKLRSILFLNQTNISRIRKILGEILERINWHEPSRKQLEKMIKMTWDDTYLKDTYNFKRKILPKELGKLMKVLPFKQQVSLQQFLQDLKRS